jgi:hypothetical protein
LAFGPTKAEVQAAIRKFNDVDRKDGLRDMCEIVERLTEELGVAACRKGWMKILETDFRTKDWASQINELARKDVYHPPRAPLINQSLNLLDHKARSKREDTKRQKQFAERMMQGPRLTAELIALKRKVK